MYYGKLTFQDAYNLPVSMRQWWIKRVNQAVEEHNKHIEKQSR